MRNPPLAVVVPARNEAATIAACLHALSQQIRNQDAQLVVVDNGSTDKTAEIAREFGAEVVDEPRIGVARARQMGFRATNAEIIATTDADSVVPPHWLATIVSHFRANADLVGLGGPVTYPFREARLRQAMAQILTNFFLLDQSFHAGKAHLVGANFAVRRSAFLAVGGFRTELLVGEDTDLTHRLHDEGTVLFVPDLVVTTSSRRLKETGPALIINYVRTYLEITEPSLVIRRRILRQILASQQSRFHSRSQSRKGAK